MAVRSLKNSTIENFANYSSSMNAGYSFQDYELIESVFVASPTASVTFSSLGTYSSTYRHLQIRYAARSSVNAIWDSGSLRFNSDIGNNYASHALGGTGTPPYSEAGTTRASISVAGGGLAGNTLATNSFTGGVIDILDPYSTTKNKTTRELSGATGAEYRVRLGSGLWMNTASVTTIALTCSANWLAGSRFSLYGIR
jgi:hypothetical protein